MTEAIDFADFETRAETLARTAEEMAAQDEKWGAGRSYPLTLDGYYGPDGIPPLAMWRSDYEKLANDTKRDNDNRASEGCLAWDGILLEEVYEALAEDDPGLACKELIQVAAVALQVVLSIERNGLNGRQ